MTRVVPQAGLLYLLDADPSVLPGVPGAIQYAFGVLSSNNSLWFHIGTGATAWINLSGGGGSGGIANQRVFTYTVTGLEPDPTEIVVPLPAAMPTTSYQVFVSCQGCVNVVATDVAQAGKSTTQFVLSTTDSLVAGDKVAFYVSPTAIT